MSKNKGYVQKQKPTLFSRVQDSGFNGNQQAEQISPLTAKLLADC